MRSFYLSIIAAMLLATPVVSGAAGSNPKQAVAAKAAGQLGQEMRKKLTESMQKMALPVRSMSAQRMPRLFQPA